tara:strand:+ start:8073 stop:8582 length:510 start_codon:yes stop_codon:yes gene_type:complete
MLDCHTPKGKIYIRSESETADFIEKNFLAIKNVRLQKFDDDASRADRLAISAVNKELALLEIKSRNLNKKTLETAFNNEYLISQEKVDINISRAKKSKIPFLIFVNLMEDDYILRIKISDHEGNITAPHRRVTKTTQRTCNGGTKEDSVYLFGIHPPHAYFISKSKVTQ